MTYRLFVLYVLKKKIICVIQLILHFEHQSKNILTNNITYIQWLNFSPVRLAWEK